MVQRRPEAEPQSPNWLRRIALVAVGVTALLLIYGFVYQWVMVSFEDRVIPYGQAIQVVVESVTTAGFGGHAPWESTAANLLIIAMNLTGVVLVFTAIPVFVAPLLRQLVERQPPRSSDLTGHVIVCGYSDKDEVLREELQHFSVEREKKIPFLYVEPDEKLARELRRRDIEAVVGDPERVESLRAVNADRARALVADVDDETNPSVVLAAKVVDEDLPVLSVVRNHRVAPHHEYAGAARVIEAREAFARGLAMRVSSSYAQKFREVIDVENGVEVTEVVVEEGCPMIGQTLRDARLGALGSRSPNVIAAWVGGKFLISPSPDTPIRKNSILVVAGRVSSLERRGMHAIPSSVEPPSRVVIGGFGTVGRGVDAALEQEGIETTVIDRDERKHRVRGTDGDEKRGPDITGDITEVATLREANLDEADAVVLVLDRDVATIYATIVINEIAPEVEIIARADKADSISTLYQAGADFVLSLADVTGEILASELLELFGETGGFLPADTEFEFTRIDGKPLDGQRLMDIDLRRKTGCTVVAVERDEELLSDIRGEFVIEEDDTLIVAGSKEAIESMHDDIL